MPAATNKTDLLAVTQKEFSKLQTLIANIPDEQAKRKREEDTSIKDVIAHRAHWIELFLGWYRDGQAGHEVFFPAEGYKWNDLKIYNAQLRADQAGLGWHEAKDALEQGQFRLMQLIEDMSDTQLYVGPMKGANSAWTTGRWAEAAGASHYRSAAKWVRACKRADA
ncbi:MAG: ClbS/DfsB family four-helix bundle protein [Octadecabacter sp.]|nr:ClbS/DfsB family four-helix bundle protein [Octadecabacter sp.]